jgi:hypothetical protein
MKKSILLILCIFSIGCARPFVPFLPPEVNFTASPYYEGPGEFNKPGKPQGIVLLDANFQETSDDGAARYLAMPKEEFAKIIALNRLFKAQDTALKDQTVLVNIHIATINQLKELLALKDAEIKEYISLWTNAENTYRREKNNHDYDNLINKVTNILLLGGIVALAL